MTQPQDEHGVPSPPPLPHVSEPDWFRRFPNGGIVYQKPVRDIDWFRRAPNGGGTVYARPSDSGNPYARIDEDPDMPRPVVVVELPEYEEGPA